MILVTDGSTLEIQVEIRRLNPGVSLDETVPKRRSRGGGRRHGHSCGKRISRISLLMSHCTSCRMEKFCLDSKHESLMPLANGGTRYDSMTLFNPATKGSKSQRSSTLLT